MIEVIKHVKMKENHNAECPECGCEFKFQRDDCSWERCLQSYAVKCPECGEIVYVGDIFDK